MPQALFLEIRLLLPAFLLSFMSTHQTQELMNFVASQDGRLQKALTHTLAHSQQPSLIVC